MKKNRWPLLSFLLLSLSLEIKGQNPFFGNPGIFSRVNPNFLTNGNFVRRNNLGGTVTGGLQGTTFTRTRQQQGQPQQQQQQQQQQQGNQATRNQATRNQPTGTVGTVTVPIIDLGNTQQQQQQQSGLPTNFIRQATAQSTNQQFPFGTVSLPQSLPTPFAPSFGGPPVTATGFAFGGPRPLEGGFGPINGPTVLGLQPNGFGLGESDQLLVLPNNIADTMMTRRNGNRRQLSRMPASGTPRTLIGSFSALPGVFSNLQRGQDNSLSRSSVPTPTPSVPPQVNFLQTLPSQAVVEMQAAAARGFRPQFGVLQTQPIGSPQVQRATGIPGPPAQPITGNGNFLTGQPLGQGPVSGFPPTGFNGFPSVPLNFPFGTPLLPTNAGNAPGFTMIQPQIQGTQQQQQQPRQQQTQQRPQQPQQQQNTQQQQQQPQQQQPQQQQPNFQQMPPQFQQFPQNIQLPQFTQAQPMMPNPLMPQLQLPQLPQLTQITQNPQTPQTNLNQQTQGQQPQQTQQNQRPQTNNPQGGGLRPQFPQFPRFGGPSPFAGQALGFPRPNIRQIPRFRGMNVVMPGIGGTPQPRIPQNQPATQGINTFQTGLPRQPQGAQIQNNQVVPQVQPPAPTPAVGQNPFSPPAQQGQLPGFQGQLPGIMPQGRRPFPGVQSFGGLPPNFPGQGIPPAAPQARSPPISGFSRTNLQSLSRQQSSATAPQISSQTLSTTQFSQQSLPALQNTRSRVIPHTLPRLTNQQATPLTATPRRNFLGPFPPRRTDQQTSNQQSLSSRPSPIPNFLAALRTPASRSSITGSQTNVNPISQDQSQLSFPRQVSNQPERMRPSTRQNFLDSFRSPISRLPAVSRVPPRFQQVSRQDSGHLRLRALPRPMFQAPVNQQSTAQRSGLRPVSSQVSAQPMRSATRERTLDQMLQRPQQQNERLQPLSTNEQASSNRQPFNRLTADASPVNTNTLTDQQPPAFPPPPPGISQGSVPIPAFGLPPPGLPQTNPNEAPPSLFGSPVPAFPALPTETADPPGNEAAAAPVDASNSISSVPGFGTEPTNENNPVEVPTLINNAASTTGSEASPIAPGQSPPGFPQMTFTGDFGTRPLDIASVGSDSNTESLGNEPSTGGPSPPGAATLGSPPAGLGSPPAGLGSPPPGFGSPPPGMGGAFQFGVDTIPTPFPPPPVVPVADVPNSIQLGIDQPVIRPGIGSVNIFSDTGSIGVIPDSGSVATKPNIGSTDRQNISMDVSPPKGGSETETAGSTPIIGSTDKQNISTDVSSSKGGAETETARSTTSIGSTDKQNISTDVSSTKGGPETETAGSNSSMLTFNDITIKASTAGATNLVGGTQQMAGFPNIPSSGVAPVSGSLIPVPAETQDKLPTVVSVAGTGKSKIITVTEEVEPNVIPIETPAMIDTGSSGKVQIIENHNTMPSGSESTIQLESQSSIHSGSHTMLHTGSQITPQTGIKSTTKNVNIGFTDSFPPKPNRAITEGKPADAFPFLRQ